MLSVRWSYQLANYYGYCCSCFLIIQRLQKKSYAQIIIHVNLSRTTLAIVFVFDCLFGNEAPIAKAIIAFYW